MPKLTGDHMCDEEKSDNIEYRFVRSWPPEDIVSLYKAGGWWKDHYDPKGILPLIEKSFAFTVAVDEKSGRTLGMGRIISDGVSDAYLQDIVVLPEHRRKGIGKKILKKMVEHCRKQGLVWIGLIAEESTEDFYSTMGFKRFEGQPMVYEPGDN